MHYITMCFIVHWIRFHCAELITLLFLLNYMASRGIALNYTALHYFNDNASPCTRNFTKKNMKQDALIDYIHHSSNWYLAWPYMPSIETYITHVLHTHTNDITLHHKTWQQITTRGNTSHQVIMDRTALLCVITTWRALCWVWLLDIAQWAVGEWHGMFWHPNVTRVVTSCFTIPKQNK